MLELLQGQPSLLIVVGLALLALGGYLVVGAGVGLAKAFNLSPLVIGVVFLGFGTSLPEMLVSLRAALAGAPGVSIGNVVGSNIANLLLIAGVGAAIMHAKIGALTLWRDGGYVLLATIGLAALLLLLPRLGAEQGYGLLAALLVYILIALVSGRPQEGEELDDFVTHNILILLGMFGAGVAATLYGAGFLVEGAVLVAARFGVSESLIGLTIVAIGTSLPELAATVAAALRRQPTMALGNVLGSNVFNICAIIGVTAVVKPIDVPTDIEFDVWAMLAGTALFLVLAATCRELTRKEGFLLLLGYGAYMATTLWIVQ